MQGFVNTLVGADYIDVCGWAVHLRDQFPERRDAIDAALHLPISQEMRHNAVRRIIEGQIASLLTDAAISVSHAQPRAGSRADPARAAATTVSRIGDRALEHLARRLGISIAEARQRLVERLARGEGAAEKSD